MRSCYSIVVAVVGLSTLFISGWTQLYAHQKWTANDSKTKAKTQAKRNDDMELSDLRKKMTVAIWGKTTASPVKIFGETNQFGADSEFIFEQSADGDYLRTVRGVLPIQQGFDGKSIWEKDWCGATRELQFSDRDRLHVANLVQFGAWLSSKTRIQIEIDETESSESHFVLKLSFHDSNSPATLHVDRKTFLPSQLTVASNIQKETVIFTDFSVMAGMTIPRCSEFKIGDDVHKETVSKVEPVETQSKFTRPATDLNGVTFLRQQSLLETKRAKTGHVLVRIAIEDKGKHWFILDTGAGGTVIDQRFIDLHKPKTVGRIGLLSMFGMQKSHIVSLGQFDFGAIQLPKLFGVAMNTEFLDGVLGEKISGIVGYDLFAKCRIQLDLTSDEFRVFDVASGSGKSAEWKPLALDRKLPLVPCQLNDLPIGNFRIDVGAAGDFFSNVVIHTPYNQKYQLAEKYGVEAFEMQPHSFKVGAVPSFRIGSQTYAKPRVGFALSDQAPFNDFYSKGNIGVEFLKPLMIQLDYPNSRYSIQKQNQPKTP